MSTDFSAMLNRLLDGESLAESEARELMFKLAEGEVVPALAGALLAGLRAKGETADEIRGFATAMRDLAVHPEIPEGAPTVDTVGTGGDASGSLNLSTGTGLLAAAAGARVVKHGNRSISSRSGSADMLECLGMPLPLDEKQAVDCLQAANRTVKDLGWIERADLRPGSGFVLGLDLAKPFLARIPGNPNLRQFPRLLRIGNVEDENAVVRVVEVSVREGQFHPPRIRPAQVVPPRELHAG